MLDMGRIKTAEIKRASWHLSEKHPDMFSASFDENKKKLDELNCVNEKKTRNKIAGFLVRVAKQKNN